MMSNNWISLAQRQKAYFPAHRNDEQTQFHQNEDEYY